MASGISAGGLVTGIRQVKEERAQDRQLALTEAQFNLEKQTAERERFLEVAGPLVDEGVNAIKDYREQIDAAKLNGEDPEVIAGMESRVRALAEVTAERLGALATAAPQGIGADAIARNGLTRLEMALVASGPETKRTLEAAEQGAVTKATAAAELQGQAEAAGVSEQRVLEGAPDVDAGTYINPETGEKRRGRVVDGIVYTEDGARMPAGFIDQTAFANIEGGGAAAFGKPATNILEKDFVNVTNGIARAEALREAFDPEFLTWWSQAKAKGLEAVEKAGFTLNDSQKEFLTDFSTFSRRAKEDLNLTIRAITGAQMSAQEAERIKAQVATLEDSPTSFIAKLDDIIASLEEAQIRTALLKEAGMDMEALRTLAKNDQFPMSTAGARMEYNRRVGALVESGLPPEEAIRQVDRELGL